MLLKIIEILLFIFFVGLVTYRMFKYKFKKLNVENIGLIFLAGLMVKVSEVQKNWFYLLLALDAVLLIILLAGLVKERKQKGSISK